MVVVDARQGKYRTPRSLSEKDSKRIADDNEESNSTEEEVELDIKETIVLEERDSHILRTLLWGLPSPSSSLWSLATIGINLTLALFAADMIFRGPLLYPSHDVSFARVGYVSENSAHIFLREPDVNKLPLYLSYREVANGEDSVARNLHSEDREDPWVQVDKIYWLSEETDFTYSVTIPDLRPNTRYQYSASINHNGFFTTAPPKGHTAPQTTRFTFLTSSCIKPHFPYNPLHHPLVIPGLNHLANWIPKLQVSFMLFLGDFIYIDVPRRFGSDKETYRRDYRQVYASPDWPSVSTSLPWIHVIDDHEIANDWDSNTSHPYPSAIDPWNLYHASVNPPPIRPNLTYYSFTQGSASFFLLDTRRYRTPEFAAEASSQSKSMLGPAQLSDLLTFLRTPSPAGIHWKFVVSSVPFTRNWRFGDADTWGGYLHERQRVLEAMWDVGAMTSTGVVILSGDRHEFAATSFPPPEGSQWPLAATVHEFSTSPLSMFYLPVRTYSEVDGEGDVCIKYIPDGMSKFGAVEIEGLMGGEQSLLRFRLFVDGEETWEYVLSSPPGGRKGRGKDAVWG